MSPTTKSSLSSKFEALKFFIGCKTGDRFEYFSSANMSGELSQSSVRGSGGLLLGVMSDCQHVEWTNRV